MAITVTSRGQVTIPKHIRDVLHLQPGAAVEFAINAAGEVVLHRARPMRKGTRAKTASMRCGAAPTCAGAPMS